MSSTVPSPVQDRPSGSWHDLFFRAHFQQLRPLRSLLKLALPSNELKQYDLRTVRLVSGALFDAPELRGYQADLIVEVRLRRDAQQRVHFVFEHKSSKDGRVMGQLLSYITLLYQSGSRAVLPVIIYHGCAEWHGRQSFAAWRHAGLDEEFLQFNRHRLLDFETIFVNLREVAVRRRLRQLPLKEALVLEVMADIWEADERRCADWVARARRLTAAVRRSFISSLVKYLSGARQSIIISKTKKMLNEQLVAMPGDEDMQDVMRIWEELQPDSVAEAWQLGHDSGREEGRVEGREEGREEGHVKGREEGAQESRCQIAERMIRAGYSDRDVETATQFSQEEIAKLRNGGL